jgi:hypothetical protein
MLPVRYPYYLLDLLRFFIGAARLLLRRDHTAARAALFFEIRHATPCP